MKHEFLILDKDGVILPNHKVVQDIFGASVVISDIQRKYPIKKLDKGWLFPWDLLQKRYDELGGRLDELKKRNIIIKKNITEI